MGCGDIWNSGYNLLLCSHRLFSPTKYILSYASTNANGEMVGITLPGILGCDQSKRAIGAGETPVSRRGISRARRVEQHVFGLYSVLVVQSKYTPQWTWRLVDLWICVY